MGLLDKILGKGKKGAGDLVTRVISMKQQGMGDDEIISQLSSEGVPPSTIDEVLRTANEQIATQGPPTGDLPGPGAPMPPPPGMPAGPPVPPPPVAGAPMPPPPGQVAEIEEEAEDIEALVEKLVAEKTEGMESRLKDLEADVGNIRADLQEIKRTLADLKEKYAGLQEESLAKVEEYAKELENVGAQVRAMQRILQQIVPTLSENIVQLQKLVEKLKK